MLCKFWKGKLAFYFTHKLEKVSFKKFSLINEIDKSLARLIRIKKEDRYKLTILRTKRGNITDGFRYNKDNKCYKQLHANKFTNLDKMDNFHERHKLLNSLKKE